MTKKLGIIILVCVSGLAAVYYLPVFLGPIIFGQELQGALGFMALVSKLWWWILLGTLVVATILSVVFKTQGKSIKKVWAISGIIIGVAFFIMVFSLLMGTSALYQGAF
jgi:hypothetical protein